MSLEYAKELLAVDCQRIIDTVERLDSHTAGQLTAEENEAKNRLLAAAVDAVKVFKHPEGDPR